MSDWNDNLLTVLQEDIAGRLDNDSFFVDVPVLEARKGIVDSDIEMALGSLNSKGGKAGAVVIVLMPEVDAPEGETPGPQIEVVQSIQVITRPLVNADTEAGGTGKDAESIALNVLNLLHRYISQRIGHVIMADPRPIRPITAQGEVQYMVVVRLRTGLDRTAKVRTPAVYVDDDSITLTCPTADAAIYYTIDGSYPGPANPQAALYSVPFTLPPETTEVMLLVVAYKADHIPSDNVMVSIEHL
jgi:hypothetical protein